MKSTYNYLYFTIFFLFSSFLSAVAQMNIQRTATTNIPYLEHLPEDYQTPAAQGKKYPILFFLHGTGERGDGTDAMVDKVAANGTPKHIQNGHTMTFTVNGETHSFIVISPQLLYGHGNWPSGYIDEVVQFTLSKYRVDESRIYLTGLSLGGAGVWRYGAEHADVFAAIVPVCGAQSPITSYARNIANNELPVWTFHGEADNTIPASHSINWVNLINSQNPAPDPNAKITLYPGVGHNSWVRAQDPFHTYHSPNMYEWMLTYTKGGSDPPANQPPVAQAGTDQTITLPTNSISLNGSASSDPDGSLTAFAWTKLSGPASITFENQNTATPTLKNLEQGVYLIQLIITDNQGATASDEVQIIVNGASNQAPIAKAGDDFEIELPKAAIKLDGSASFDPDGSLQSYQWQYISGPEEPVIDTPGQASTFVSGFKEGIYVFRLTVQDDQGKTAEDEIRMTVKPEPANPDDCNCTYTIPEGTHNIDGDALNLQPGAVICLKGGVNYGYLRFLNLKGTEANPILIKNCNGQALVTNNKTSAYNLKFLYCKHFRLTGTGNSSVEYGIKLAGSKSQGITLDLFTTNFEVDHIEIHDIGFAGIMAKTDPNCNRNSGRDDFTMYDINIHHNYIHDTEGEGMYIGNSFYANGMPSACGRLYPHSIIGAKIHHNIVKNTGWDGIQVGSVIEGGEIYNNVVENYGYKNNATHGNGIQLGEGTGGLCYNNLIKNGLNSGIHVLGYGNNVVFNNIILDSKTFGIFCDSRQPATPGDGFKFFNNTIINTGSDGMRIYAVDDNLTNLVKNNIIINPGTYDEYENDPSWKKGVDAYVRRLKLDQPNLIVSDNYFSRTPGELKFVNVADENFHLLPESPAVNKGVDVSDYGVLFDKDEVSRPVNGKYDIGAYEYIASNANQLPRAKAGKDQSLKLPANETQLDGSASYDPDGSIQTYLWETVSGPGGEILQNTNQARATVSNLVEGVYVFKLTVTDDQGDQASDEVTVTVHKNLAPIARAGADKSISLPTNSVSLDGSASSDPDGSITAFAWSKIAGPASFTIQNGNTSKPTITSLTEGIYTFQLTVTDDDGVTATDQVKITVNPEPVNQAPIARAGADKSISLPTNSVSLDGSASSDPDGSITAFAWNKIAGPASFTIQNGNTSKPTITSLVEGIYTFQLTVTDNKGAKATDQVKVTVNAAPNQAPIAKAGNDKSITLPTNSVSLDGSASSDPDGSITAFAWNKIAGPASFTIQNGNTSKPTIASLTEGIYTFQLTVTDNKGAKATDQVKVTVNAAPNQAPVAKAGADKSITLPTNSVSLDGSASSDPDGSITAFAWSKIAGPASFTIQNGNTSKPTITSLTEGVYTFQLTVTDNKGAKATDQIKITVNPEPVNQAPIAKAGNDKSITLPTNSVSLDGSASSDPDGSIAAFAWNKITGPASFTIQNGNTSKPTITSLTEGIYTFQLTVTDNKGAKATDQVKVTVNAAPNQAPIAKAGNDKSITLPTNSVSLDGSASSDPDGSITAFAWSKITGPASFTIQNGNTSKPTITSLTEGIYTFQLTVTDNKGAKATDQVKVTVNAAPNQAPIAKAGNDKSITLPTNSVSLDGSASSDPDGSITAFAWNKITGPASFTIQNGNTSKPTIINLVEGVYTFQLTVTDNKGATARDDIRVIVLPEENQAPIALAGEDIVLILPDNSTNLDGSASTDLDGQIVSYQWEKIGGPQQGNLTNKYQAIATLSNLVEGQYRYRLTVTDNDGAKDQAEINVEVKPATNQKPIAIAGEDVITKMPQNSMILDGSASYDPDGQITSFFWEQLHGPIASKKGEHTAKLILENLTPGVYTFKLTVTDNRGDTGSDQVEVRVIQEENQLPIALAGNDTIVFSRFNEVTLDGSRSYDPDGTIKFYYWKLIEHTSKFKNFQSKNAKVTLKNLPLGSYVFELTVKDNRGASARDEIQVVVTEHVQLTVNIPKFFTPNGDGKNDTWQIKNLQILGKVKIEIFNRVGKSVYSTENYKNDWDANYQGKRLSNGDYYYVMTGEDGKVYTGGIRIIH
ncbi:PKD domain-containing protein [Rapidithrix thailandica]|uniref:PKD domain-containing protein n=1 Tax=Rapidithrix thailandica TaxID=413964 RepID=A0AAW9SB94_9BACT